MLKLSVVISVYNKGKYIGRCLDSILNQTIGMKSIEIICVDDKSTDDSLDVLNKYASNNKNIKVVTSEFNSGGPGNPRNKGIKLANGKYIYFVDADDFLGEKTLKKTYDFAEENHSDIVIGKIVGFGGRETAKSMFNKTVKNVDFPNSKIVYTLNPLKLFRTNFLRENDIKFPHNIITGEDQLFTMKAYLFAEVISVLSDYNYYYLARTDGYHAAGAYISPKYFYDIMGQIMNLITASQYEQKDKDKIMKIFLERNFDFSRTKNFTIKQKTPEDREEWMFHIRKFITETVPERIDSMLSIHIQIRLKLIRNNDLETLHNFELENFKKEYTIKNINNKLTIIYSSLKNYDLPNKMFDITYKIRLFHFIENMKIENNSLLLSGRIRYDMLENSPEIICVLVHRTLKIKKYFETESKDYRFNCNINLNELFDNYLDLGVWDLFFKVKDFKTQKLWRIGNKREKTESPKYSYYFTEKNDDLIQIEPFFTKDYDNLSFNISKNRHLKLNHEEINHEENIKDSNVIKFPINMFISEKLELFLINSNKSFKVDNIENNINGANLHLSQINNQFNINNINQNSSKLKKFRHLNDNIKYSNNDLKLIASFKSLQDLSKINILKNLLSKYFDYFINKIKIKIYKTRTK